MLYISRHSFQSVVHQFFQRTDILVRGAKYAYRFRFFFKLVFIAIPKTFVGSILNRYLTAEFFFQLQSFFDFPGDGILVKVGVGNGDKQGIVDKFVCVFRRMSLFAQVFVVDSNSPYYKE